MKFKECKFILKWLSLCLCCQGWVSSQSLRAVPLGLFWNKNTWSRCTSRHLLSLDYHCYMASHWFVILSTCSVLMFVNTWLLTQLPIWQDATQGSRLLSIICLRYWDKKYYLFANFMGLKQGGLATAFDLAAFRLSMIAPVKKSVNHSSTVASMRETGWEQPKKSVFAAIPREVNSLLVPLVIAFFAVTNFCPR